MKDFTNFKIPHWDELPDIPLYLDQILQLLEDSLGEYLITDDKKIMTKTMVNNYVKHKYIPAPVNKKYNKIAVASIFIIAMLKSVFTIEEISKLIGLALKSCDNTAEVYNMFCGLAEEAVRCAFNGETIVKDYNLHDPRFICQNACNAFASQLYVRQIYLHHPHTKEEICSVE